jgi:hypothetical protein
MHASGGMGDSCQIKGNQQKMVMPMLTCTMKKKSDDVSKVVVFPHDASCYKNC